MKFEIKKSSVKKLKECVRRLSRIEKKYQKVGREGQLVVALLRQVEADLNSNLGECPKINRRHRDYESLTEVYGVAEPLAEIIENISVFDIGTMIRTLRRMAENGPSVDSATPLPGHLDSASPSPDLGNPTRVNTPRSDDDMQDAQSVRRTIGMDCEDEGCPHFTKPHFHANGDLAQVGILLRAMTAMLTSMALEFIKPDWQPAVNLPHAVGDNLLQFANWFISENATGEDTEVILNIKLMVDIRKSGNILSKFTADFE